MKRDQATSDHKRKKKKNLQIEMKHFATTNYFIISGLILLFTIKTTVLAVSKSNKKKSLSLYMKKMSQSYEKR